MTKLNPPKETFKDNLNSIVKIGIASIPLVGGPAVEFYNLVMKSPIEKKREAFFNSVVLKIDQLEETYEEFKPENLKNNDEFLSIILRALQNSTIETHSEKIELFKNVIFNSILIKDITSYEKFLFLNYLENFSFIHISVLKHFVSESNRSSRSSISHRQNIYANYTKYNELKIEENMFFSVINDLETKRLIKIKELRNNDDNNIIYGYMIERAILGDKFINFIKNHV